MLDMLATDDEGLELALVYWTYGKIVEHRRISPEAIGAEMGVTGSWVRKLLNGQGSRSALRRAIFSLDHAISEISARRGGVMVSCGCTPKVLAELALDISKGDHWNER